MLLAAALLAAVPRLRMTVRRMAPPVLQVGIGITLLNTVGKSFVGLVQRNPAYGLVGRRRRRAGLPLRLQPAAAVRRGLGGDQPARPGGRPVS